MSGTKSALLWALLAVVAAVPLAAAATSPLIAYRQPVYIAAGFAGIIAMIFLLVQPLLIAGRLPGLQGPRGRRVHALVGTALLLAVGLHVAGLWITSPPDVIDALLFRSPTRFSAFGVLAMWALIAAALVAGLRRSRLLAPRHWRRVHAALTASAVIGSILHALMIEGTMETLSKIALCVLVLAATLLALKSLKP